METWEPKNDDPAVSCLALCNIGQARIPAKYTALRILETRHGRLFAWNRFPNLPQSP